VALVECGSVRVRMVPSGSPDDGLVHLSQDDADMLPFPGQSKTRLVVCLNRWLSRGDWLPTDEVPDCIFCVTGLRR